MDQSGAPGALRAFAASLVRCLRGWDPLGADAHGQAQQQPKQRFVDALTEISALTADALAMEVRRLVVDPENHDDGADDGGRHLAHLVAALGHRDVLLKCKVANAVGSLCTSRVAGQRLLELHGAALVASLARMATSKNTWAQADAFFVFGWMVVVGEDALVDAQLPRFVATAVRLVTRNLERRAPSPATSTPHALEEQDANLRIYCLVFLLNFSQRDAAALAPELVGLLEMLRLLVSQMLEPLLTAAAAPRDDDPNGRELVGEYLEFVRLGVTLLHALVEQVDAAPATILSLKMLPQLLKLEQALHSAALEQTLRGGARDSSDGDDEDPDGDDQANAEEEQGVGGEDDEVDAQLEDLRERMRAIKETVLAHR